VIESMCNALMLRFGGEEGGGCTKDEEDNKDQLKCEAEHTEKDGKVDSIFEAIQAYLNT
jgi:hypothetical protein